MRRAEEKMHFYKLNFFKAKRSHKVCEDEKSIFELSSRQHKRFQSRSFPTMCTGISAQI